MRRVLTLALASAAAIGLSSAANAAVTLTTATSNFNTHITAQGNVPGDPLSTINDVPIVYGTDGTATSDVKFTGNTSIEITDGNGFASISDAPGNNTLFQSLIIDPLVNDFTAFQFSVATLDNTWLLIQYATAADPNTFLNVTMGADDPPLKGVSNPFWSANGNTDYTITSDSTTGPLSKILIQTCGGTAPTKSSSGTPDCTTFGSVGFSFIKQNSMIVATSTPGVPEPATWALMLLGFGGIGVAMRRGRKQSSLLSQIA